MFLTTIVITFEREGLLHNYTRSTISPPPTKSWPIFTVASPYTDDNAIYRKTEKLAAGDSL